MPAESPSVAIRKAFAAAAGQLDGVTVAFDHEPEELPNFDDGAIVTMLIRRADPQITETGGSVDVTWEWRVFVQVLLSDYVAAQERLEAVLPGLLLITMVDSTLDGSCLQANLGDPGGDPFPEASFDGDDAPMTLVKELRLRAVAELAP